MHLLNRLDRLVKRSTLSREAGINYVYLSSLASKKDVSEDVEKKLKKAVKKIIRQLEQAIK